MSWTIDGLSASSVAEAAEQALRLLNEARPGNPEACNVFEVTGPDRVTYGVDLGTGAIERH